VFIGGHIIETAPTNEGEGYFDRTDCYQQRVRGASPLGESNPNLYPEDTIMTEEELRTLIGNLAISTASNTEANRELRAMVESQGESIRELRAAVESQERVMTEGFASLTATIASQERVMTEGFASLTATAESQARSIESMRESVSYNTEMVTSALTLVSEALKLSANTSKNLDRLEIDIADLKQIVGIVISESQADRVRFSRLEGQD
jgi:hypothetical protein